MEPIYVVKNQTKLRVGYTTGSCAASACKAAADMLLSGQRKEHVRFMTPKGIELYLNVLDISDTQDCVRCAVEKDGGDDPDVTNGLKIYAEVSKISEGIVIEGGEGVGRVTRAGLACAPGGPAINPVPRAMISAALTEIAQKYQYRGGFRAVISAPGGEQIAKQTFNSRLGIVGGISILGTSGIVEPMSEQALIDTIHVELDSKKAAGEHILFLCPGNYGQNFARQTLKLSMEDSVLCSNFIGDTLDYAVYLGFPAILLIGHAGKLIKLAGGIFQTHSSVADGRQEIFASHAALCGADRETVRRLMDSITADECIEILKERGLEHEVLHSIKQKMQEHLSARISRHTAAPCRLEFILFTNKWGELMRTDGAQELIENLQNRENVR